MAEVHVAEEVVEQARRRKHRIPLIVRFKNCEGEDRICANARKRSPNSVKRENRSRLRAAMNLTPHELAALREDPDVLEIFEDLPVHKLMDVASGVGNVSTVWANYLHNNGKGVIIGIVDSGVDPDHPDFVGRIVAAQDFTTENNIRDFDGHGTHVAGIAAGSGAASDGLFRGVAYGSKIVNGKVLTAEGMGFTSDVLDAIDWCIFNGAKIVNLSLGSQDFLGASPYDASIANAEANGVLIVAAAGNDGPDAGTVVYPAGHVYSVAVASAVDEGTIRSDSSRGPTLNGLNKPDIAAPGTNIKAPLSGNSTDTAVVGYPQYVSYSGTSMAAPYIAGVAACYLSARPTLTVPQLKALLYNNATAIYDPQDPNREGSGLVDAYEGMAELEGPLSEVHEVSWADDPDYDYVFPPSLQADITWARETVGVLTFGQFESIFPDLVRVYAEFVAKEDNGVAAEFVASVGVSDVVLGTHEAVYEISQRTSIYESFVSKGLEDFVVGAWEVKIPGKGIVSKTHVVLQQDNPRIARSFTAVMPAVSNVHRPFVAAEFVTTGSVHAAFKAVHTSGLTVRAPFVVPTGFVSGVRSEFVGVHALEQRTSVFAPYRAVYSFDPDLLEISIIGGYADPDAEEISISGWYVTHKGDLVSAYNFEVSIDEGDFGWSGTVYLGDYNDYAHIRQNDPITIYAGGEVYSMVVDGKDRNLDGPAEVALAIHLVSPTTVYDFPRAQPVTKTWNAEVFAAAAAQEHIVSPIDWRALDWPIKAFRLGVDNVSPIRVAQTIASAIGATVETTREGALYVRPLYYHSTEFLYNDVAPEYLLDDQRDIFTLRETYSTDRLVNRIRIVDVELSYADTMEWLRDDGSSTEGELRAFPSPYRTMQYAPVTTTSPTDVVSLLPVEEVVWEVEEPELVEIYEGSGEVKYPIHEVTNIFWESIPLSGVAFDEGSKTLRSVNEDDLYGLARITYTTRYHSYRVSGTLDRAAQFLMADTSEE